MKVEIVKGQAVGCVKAPPSKSMAHRNLICGAYSSGSTVRGVDMSKDVEATLSCLESLGARVEYENGVVRLGGLDAANIPDGAELYANESGSTLRFFIPICLLSDKKITIRGNENSKLFSRPLDIYENICRECGLGFELGEASVTLQGPLKAGEYSIPGDVSSQFISGMLFALPKAGGKSVIRITGKFESASYIDLTLAALENFGVKIERPDERTFVIDGNSTFYSRDVEVEGDWSNAAFFEALNYLGGEVEVTGLKADSAQGDRVYGELFERIKSEAFPIDISDCPDLAPVLFAVSAALGRGVFTGTRRLKIKESDRAGVMREELAKFGAEVTVEENDVTVKCEKLMAPTELLCGHNDHRIVMSLSVLATLTGGEIDEAEAISKSFPDFFEKLSSLGVTVK